MSDEFSQLSEREREILKLVATGATNQQIALDLGISVNTVKVHLRNIFGKIGAASRTEATMAAVRAGLVELGSTNTSIVEEVRAPAESGPALQDETLTAVAPAFEAPVDALLSQEEAGPAVRQQRTAQKPWMTIVGMLGGMLIALVVLWIMGGRFPALTSQPTSVPVASNGAAGANAIWTAQSELPVVLSAAAASSYDGRIYIIAGLSAKGVSAKGWSYNPGQSSWNPIADKPTAVSSAQAVVLGGKIWVPGGENNGSISNKLEVFDPKTNTWSEKAPLPEPRSGYGIAAIDGRLYVFGGWDGTQVRAETFVYDPAANSWSNDTPMPTARSYLSAATIDGKVYVLGGEDSSGVLQINEVFTPVLGSQGSWDTSAPMPMLRSRFSSVAVNNFVIVLGGDKGEPPVRFDIRTLRWDELKAPPLALGAQPVATVRDSSVFVASGDILQAKSPFYALALPYNVFLPVTR